ncbi:TPA: hypothetical protein HI105_004868, partial [Escherichia coli]|nr:hypothetical protein [Escherichia coli]
LAVDVCWVMVALAGAARCLARYQASMAVAAVVVLMAAPERVVRMVF